MEVEADGKIPFLDMKLRRSEDGGLRRSEDGGLSSTWFCKPTDTGLVMNFHALAPKRYKESVVSGFVHRIFRACSSWNNFQDGLERVKSILEKNQYPPQFYNSVIQNTKEKLLSSASTTKPIVEETNLPKHRVILQYRGSITDQFVKRLNDCDGPVQTVLTLRKLRSSMPSLKCEVPYMLKSRVIYKLTCPHCQACYVGRTCRHLHT